MYLYISPKLPDRETYTNLRLENPLRIYSADNKLIAEFGSRRSTPVKYEEIPQLVLDALISSEDKRFYSHHGVDPLGLLRSVAGIFTGNDWGGGSTITMQVTKNFFFEGESPQTRKFKEILLALKMEGELTKEEILELYLNKTFFGISAYGIAAAAEQYYDKDISALSSCGSSHHDRFATKTQCLQPPVLKRPGKISQGACTFPNVCPGHDYPG